MQWNHLTTIEQLDEIALASSKKPVVIFKHSTHCSISRTALNRMEQLKNVSGADFYYLDLLNYRSVSNKVAEQFEVNHESPQLLLIKDGECVYEESHLGITADDLIEQIAALKN